MAPNPGTQLPLGVTKQPTSRPQDSSPGARRPPRGRSRLTKTDTPRGSEAPETLLRGRRPRVTGTEEWQTHPHAVRRNSL